MLRVIASVAILVCVQALPSNVDLTNGQPAPYYDFVQRVAEDGFYSETHHVTTNDGYILEILRIPHGRVNKGTGRKPVVFMMHGLQSSAITFLQLGPERSLGYMLADAGYDVWLGNARGVLNSRYNVRLDPDNPADKREFFNFSFEDIAKEDLPAMIDYILHFTKEKKLHYIGHSQGGTVFYALNALKPVYSEKFISVHLLAGVGYQKHFPNTILGLAAISTNAIYSFAYTIGAVELLGPETNAEVKCSDDNTNTEACSLWTIKDVMADIYGNMEVIAGASLKQYAHFGQNIRDRRFKRWDYGPVGNLLKYGDLYAPDFNISFIDVDITLHYSLGDELLDEQDVLDMAAVIPNAKVRKVSDETFQHADYVMDPKSKELVSDYIVQKLNEKHR